jgi:hypothetical protein
LIFRYRLNEILHMSGLDSQTIAWIFYAIHLAGPSNGALRADINFAADAINHAVPTPVEFEGAVTALIGRGLVKRHGELFSISEAGEPIMQKAQRATMQATVRALAQLLPISNSA